MRGTRLLGGIALALTVPLVGGCSALGFPELPPSSSTPFGVTFGDPAPSPDPAATPAPVQTPGYFASVDGYSLTLPVGWAAVDVDPGKAGALVGLLATTDPILADLASLTLDETGAELSMLGADLVAATTTTTTTPPAMVVLGLRTRGQPRDAVRRSLEAIVTEVPALEGEVEHEVVALEAGDAHRYALTVVGEASSLRLQAYVFRVGGDTFIVAFFAPVELWDGTVPLFDGIVDTLRFGV
jgi:hypothetical protein